MSLCFIQFQIILGACDGVFFNNILTEKSLIRIGSNFTLHCICHNVVVKWYHNDTLAGNITSVDITFNKITKSVSGIYKCIEQEYNVTNTVQIIVYCE